MLRSNASRTLFAFPLLALAALGNAQLNIDGTGYLGPFGPSNGNSGSTDFGSLDIVAQANYDDGLSSSAAVVSMSGSFDSASIGFGFGGDNATYYDLSGQGNVVSSDTLTFSNSEGAIAGKYKIRYDYSIAKSAGTTLSATINGFDISGTGSFETSEMDFLYDSFVPVEFALRANAESLNFPSGDFSDWGAVQARISFIVTDTGGASSFSAFGTRGNYDVQAVPEPASMVALGIGAAGLLRRRLKK